MRVSLAELTGRTVRDERGGVLVMVAVALPMMVLMASFVVDIANWFEHKRHLQMQADAAVLAGAREYAIPCANEPVIAEATAYGGATYNAQVGGTPPENVHTLFNSRTYYNQTSNVDDTVVEGTPCDAKMLDVKLTETDLPWFFRVAQVPFINAHARVSLMQVDTASGALPVGVPDVNPKKVRVSFIDESNGSVLGTTDLSKQPGTTNGLAIWDNALSPLPVTTNARHIGVRVAVGGHLSATCGDPQVDCFDADSANGLLYARGWTAAGSGAQPNEPIARSVMLFNGTCADPYFSAESGTCTVGVRAKVDFGSGDPSAVGAGLTAVVDRNDYPLTYDPASDSWASSATIPVPPAAGPLPVELEWRETIGTVGSNECKEGGGNKCKGTFGIVQRTFGASAARSGPIKVAQISEDGSFWANSFERCSTVQPTCTHNLVRDDRDRGQPPERLRRQRSRGVAAGDRRQPEPVARLRPELLEPVGRAGLRLPADLHQERGHRLPGQPGRPLGLRATLGLRRHPDGLGDEPGPGGNEPSNPRGEAADRLHFPEQLGRLSEPLSRRPADRSGLPHSLRVVLGERERKRPGNRLRHLLRHGLDCPGTGLRQPVPGKRRRPGPEQRRRIHRRPFHQVHRHLQQLERIGSL